MNYKTLSFFVDLKLEQSHASLLLVMVFDLLKHTHSQNWLSLNHFANDFKYMFCNFNMLTKISELINTWLFKIGMYNKRVQDNNSCYKVGNRKRIDVG